jgi:hypothetical protein
VVGFLPADGLVPHWKGLAFLFLALLITWSSSLHNLSSEPAQSEVVQAPESSLNPDASQPVSASVAREPSTAAAVLVSAPKVPISESNSETRKRAPTPVASTKLVLLPDPIDRLYPAQHITCVLSRVQRVERATLGSFLI